MINEKWKVCPLNENYEASDLGRIRRIGSAKPLKTDNKIAKNGYMNCSLGRGNHAMVHRIIAITWLGNPPTDRHQVNHINCNKLDNRVSNIEWVTPKENLSHARKSGLLYSHSLRFKTKFKGCNNPNAKLSLECIAWLRWSLLFTKIYQKDLADLFGVSMSTIQKYRKETGKKRITPRQHDRNSDGSFR